MDTVEIKPQDILGEMELLVDIGKSTKRPKGDTTVIKTEHGDLFPEAIQLYNHKDEYLYAFGSIHTWRSSDGDNWELVW